MSFAAELHNAHKARLERIAQAAERHKAMDTISEQPKPRVSLPPIISSSERVDQLERRIQDLEEVIDRQGELLAKLFKDTLSDTPRFNEVVEAVCAFYGITLVQITSARRTASLVKPRQIVCYLARKLTGLSMPQIAKRLGGRDHTTVLHGANKIQDDMKKDDILRDDLDLLELKIAEKVLNREAPRGKQIVHRLPVMA